MAKIPTPRSYNQILGDLIDAFLSRYGLKSLKVGSPVLSLVEAAAQSDLRSSQDIMSLLNAQSLALATGVALDRIGQDEDLPRQTEAPASGVVTISDTRFNKVATKVYQGRPAPIIGSGVVHVTDASAFPSSGSIYIGRGTSNYEGALDYSSKVFNGTYWTLTLDDNTRRFHNLGESVVLAQGGNRAVPAGTVVQTPQGNSTDAVRFATLFAATIPDGEVEIASIQVVAQRPGVSSNVSAGAISSFVTPPFTDASVTNPLPFTNGQPAWDDPTYREAIKNARQSRSKGTALALRTAVQGITSQDENKRVASASVVTRQGYPTTVYIDDGTGYEERAQGTALETLMDLASGGEQYFQVSGSRPLAKAHLITTVRAPFKLRSASKLAIKVGGVTSEHTFDAGHFRNIDNATAYEVVASINANHTLAFSAATAEAGTKVRLFAKEDENENLELTQASGLDANEDLLFPAGRQDTMKLYRNDRLLSKDGKIASLRARPVAQWGALTNGEDLDLTVDGTATVNYIFTDQDFVAAQTGFSTVGRNSVAAWVKAINAKCPGVTASEASGILVLTSNAGRSSRAQLTISGGSLVNKQVFDVGSAQGEDREYTLDRNTGQIRLEVPLSPGDSLSAGTVATRAFLQSEPLSTVALASNAELYFVVDGAALIIPTPLTAGSQVSISSVGAPAWGVRMRVTALSGLLPFVDVQAGDWAILQDPALGGANRGFWRVAAKAGAWIELERASIATETVTLSSAEGIVFVRSPKALQKVVIPTGANYTAASLVTALNSALAGATAEVYRTSHIRLRTNTFGEAGDVALVAANAEGKKLQLPLADAVPNTTPHLAAVESGTSDYGTPGFAVNRITAVTDSNTFTPASLPALNELVVFSRNFPDANGTRWGSNAGYRTAIDQHAGTALDARTSAPTTYLPQDRFYTAAPWAIGPQDDLVVVVDGDETGKRFQVPLWRKLKPASANYGIANAFKDADNGLASLAAAFGLSFDFTDFALYMAARVKTHDAVPTKTILWRYKRIGPDGERARIRYALAPVGQPFSVTVDTLTDGNTNITVNLINAGMTANAIKDAVNALGDACPVKATVIGTGSGTVTQSSDTEFGAGTWFQLADGVNWVRSIAYPANVAADYTLTLKKPITAALASSSDWANEDVRLVPTSAVTTARWLNAQAVTGLSSVARIEVGNDASKLQLASRTVGSSGSIQVQGGSANSGSAVVQGSASTVGAYSLVTLPASDAGSFYTGMWVSADNAAPMPKAVFSSTSSLSSVDTDGNFVVTGPAVYTVSSGPVAGKTWRVERQGRFIAYSYSIDTYGAGPTLAGTQEGDWVRVVSQGGNSLNAGIFRVVRVASDASALTFWVENPNAVEEDGAHNVTFYTADSMMPGDVLSISTDVWGQGNRGLWVVEDVGNGFTSADRFKVLGTTQAVAGPVVLGTANAPLVKTLEAQPARLIKRIRTISPNQSNTSYLDVKFESAQGAQLMSETAGTVITPLDRLSFPVDIAVGADGYQGNVGLIGEAGRVLYGDPRDPATYPGVVAAGARVNISGPLVKRITVALSLRVRSGISSSDIRDRVRSAVASVVNRTGIGQPVAISNIVAAASKVNGVVAVSVLSPTYNAGSDLIAVQPQEKPLVLNLETDVTVSFAGE